MMRGPVWGGPQAAGERNSQPFCEKRLPHPRGVYQGTKLVRSAGSSLVRALMDAFHAKCASGDLSGVQAALAGDPALSGSLDSNQWSGVHHATKHGHTDVLEALLGAGRHRLTLTVNSPFLTLTPVVTLPRRWRCRRRSDAS